MALERDAARLDIDSMVDWHEHQTLLKAAFPLAVRTDSVAAEIQFGHVTRPTHRNTSWDVARFETSMQRWVDMSEPGFGVAFLNDCKYGYDAKGNVVRLTLVKSPVFPWPDADQGLHRFRYALLVHDGDRGAVHDEAEAFNLPLQLIEGAASGPPSGAISLFEIPGDGVSVEAVKKADDGDGVVVRLCETRGRRQTVTLDFGATGREVRETNLLEVSGALLTDNVHTLALAFAPFETRTLLLRSQGLNDHFGL